MSRKKGNPNPTLPKSHGVPASETLWLPPHYGKDVKGKGGLNKAIIWTVDDVVDFIFPKKYQPKYFEVSSKFLKIILERDWITKKEISKFLKDNDYSKSTLENKIIPKLVRFGLIKREREITGGLGKGRALILSDSLTFTNYLERIGFGWNMLVSTARQKKTKTQSEM